MLRSKCGWVFLLIVNAYFSAILVAQEGDAPRLSLTQEADGVTIKIDGEVFTRYLTCSGRRPVLWPVIGPTGKPMTRAYPVGPSTEKEAQDHIHHRSIWLGYEGVNEIGFWQEPEPGVNPPFPSGEQRHREFVEVACDGHEAIIKSINDWVGPDGQKVCEDQRTWRLGTTGDQRWLDCHFVLTASEGEIRLADSKEGFFAVRVPHWMNVDSKLGGKIVSSRGLTDAAAWAQPAEWVDYHGPVGHGPVGDETVGIAILAHPSSLNYPAPWHVRTYGLFAANPLGQIAFTPEAQDVRERPLRMTLAQGESITLRHRIVLHRGDEKSARLAEIHAAYAASP